MLAKLGLADELVGSSGAPSERLLRDTWTRPPELQRIYERLGVGDQLVRRRPLFDVIESCTKAIKSSEAKL